MTKKTNALLTLLLAAVMLLTTACSSGEEVKRPANVSGDSSVTTGEAPSDTSPGNSQGADIAQITVTETVLYEADGVKITATGYKDGWMGPEITLLIENDSAKDVLVTSKSVSVNGYMMPTAALYTEIAAGKKANDTLTILSSELEQSGNGLSRGFCEFF